MSMKVYLENDQINLVHTIASASTIISSLAAETSNFIISKFPKDYFRYVQIDTGTPSSLTNKNRTYNKNVHKIPYPSLMVTPELSIDNPVAGMETDPNISSPDRWLRKSLADNYYKLLSDPDNKISMFYTTDYITVNFNFKIFVNSFIQNTNLLYFLKNELHVGLFQYLNSCPLNTEIPKTFIYIISTLLGYNIDDLDDMERFRLYMISTSRRFDSIRKKLNMSTGRCGFFMNDLTDLLIMVDGLDAPGSIIRETQTEGEYVINFRVQVSASVANKFILAIDKNKFKRLYDDVKLGEDIIDRIYSENSLEQEEGLQTISIPNIRMYSQDTIYFNDSSGEEHIGINVVHETLSYENSVSFKHINLIPFLKERLLNIHSYMVSKNLDVSSYIYVRVIDREGIRKDKKLFPNISNAISINLQTLEIDIPEIKSDILIDVFIDRSVYEAMAISKETGSAIFNNNFMATLNFSIEEDGALVTKQVIVKSFENEAEMNSIDISKQLRVNTIYGIGYIATVDENDPLASDVKVCLGKDKYGNDIIRSFVLLEE